MLEMKVWVCVCQISVSVAFLTYLQYFFIHFFTDEAKNVGYVVGEEKQTIITQMNTGLSLSLSQNTANVPVQSS